ncbi:MAG: hypothetical protein H0V82_03215 [Candidatus Protochlamydia sp.]|nr:hypothetical protein [Candidatus Protochlamydia sp.]
MLVRMRESCKDYFNSFDQLWNSRAPDTKTQICKVIKVIAYLAIYIQTVCLYRMTDLYGRITQNPDPDNEVIRIVQM